MFSLDIILFLHSFISVDNFGQLLCISCNASLLIPKPWRKKFSNKIFLVEHKKTTEEIVRVKKEKDAVTATLAKRNDQLIDAVKRAREAIKVLQPVAVS